MNTPHYWDRVSDDMETLHAQRAKGRDRVVGWVIRFMTQPERWGGVENDGSPAGRTLVRGVPRNRAREAVEALLGEGEA